VFLVPRPRSYQEDEVVDAAKKVFWARGFDGTAIGDLEEATGLSRSSLYLAFETKRAMFDAALAEYLDTFVEPLLGSVEAPGAGLREAARFFARLAGLFRDPDAQRGCLMVNSIAELAGRDPTFSPVAAHFADRVRAAFSNALERAASEGAMDRRQAARRAELLAATTLGVWVAVRADPDAAVATCRAIAAEIRSWALSAG
jgi:AcrR family transcriptional regulator